MRRVAGLIIGVVASVALAAPAQGAVGCGDTITTDRKLKKDLEDCPGTGLFIDGDGITLNMNGHAIRGTVERGIEVMSGSFNATIKNGEIRNAGNWGVLANDGNSELLIQDLAVISPASRGIQVSDSADVELAEIAVRKAGGAGIYLSGVSEVLVTDVVMSGGSGSGFDLTGVNDSRIEHGKLVGPNPDEGEDVNGISYYGGENSTFVDLELEDWDNGFDYHAEDPGNTIKKVTSRKSTFGFRLMTSGQGPQFRKVVGNGNDRDGLYGGIATDVSITGGRFNGNGDDGIQFEKGATGEVGDNVANDNGEWGIFAPIAFEVVDLGGNSAKGNGNPNQCLHVEC